MSTLFLGLLLIPGVDNCGVCLCQQSVLVLVAPVAEHVAIHTVVVVVVVVVVDVIVRLTSGVARKTLKVDEVRVKALIKD